ncbi:MAG: DNA-3-methyladenine glycosylase [Thermoproteota archaeon]
MFKRVLPKIFYSRDPEIVAKRLLGNRLIRRLEGRSLEGIIVETEAYYGLNDPASRAYHGVKDYNKGMWGEPGKIFIYNVHKYWMLNVVAHKADEIGAVLIRALKPVRGIDFMKKNRPVKKISDLTSGPGKLTVALGIDKSLNGTPVTSPHGEVAIVPHQMEFEVGVSHRIGVKHDLERKLRFYVKGNQFVSR